MQNYGTFIYILSPSFWLVQNPEHEKNSFFRGISYLKIQLACSKVAHKYTLFSFKRQ